MEKFLLGGRTQHDSVPFDKTDEGELSLCLEASHSRPRILHWRYTSHLHSIVLLKIIKILFVLLSPLLPS